MPTGPGMAFQELVAALERSLASQDNVEIVSPCYLPDKDTGSPREHDVVITHRDRHHVIRTAIECKDTGRKVGVPQVEGFANKAERTGIHRGVIVSSRGFTATARVKASALGIELMTLKDVEQFNWMGSDFIVGYFRHFAPAEVRVDCLEGSPDGFLHFLNQQGDEVPSEVFANLMQQHLNEPEDMNLLVGVQTPVFLTFSTPALRMRDAAGIIFDVSAVQVVSSYLVERRVHQVKSHSYEGENGNYALASTDVIFGGANGKLLFVRDDQHIQVVWQPINS